MLLPERSWKKLRGEENPEQALLTLLQCYRSTPAPDGKSPAELFLGRKIRTRLSLMNEAKEETVPAETPSTRLRSFSPGEPVFTKMFRGPRRSTWVPGVIQERIGQVLYRVRVLGKDWTRHVNQLKRRYTPEQKERPADTACLDWWYGSTSISPDRTNEDKTQVTDGDRNPNENVQPEPAMQPTVRNLRNRSSIRPPIRYRTEESL